MAKMPPALSGDQFEAVHIHQSHVSDLQMWITCSARNARCRDGPASKSPSLALLRGLPRLERAKM